jgi:hypothetical protein
MQSPKLVPYGPVSAPSIAAVKKLNAGFKRQIKSHIRIMERKAATLGIRSELDVLAERAGISPAQPGPCPTLPAAPNVSPAPLRLAAAAAVGAEYAPSPRFADDIAERFLEEE